MDKPTNKIKIIIASSVIVVLILAIFLYVSLKESKNEPSNENEVVDITTEPSAEMNPEEIQEQLEIVEESIQQDPTPENYNEKANLLYSQGDKEGALEAVNEGLAVNPEDELLKSKKDTIEKEFYNDPEATGGRE